jgi:hypothetical protein
MLAFAPHLRWLILSFHKSVPFSVCGFVFPRPLHQETLR